MKARSCGDSTASRFPLLVLVAALLVLAVPATVVLAQEEDTDGGDVQYRAVCQNITVLMGDITQDQQGSANAVAANGESTGPQQASAVAEAAQEQGVSIQQVNRCLNATAAGETTDGTTDGTTDRTTGETTAETTTDPEESVIVETIPDRRNLPNTGGTSLVLVPALGLLLVCTVALGNLLRP